MRTVVLFIAMSLDGFIADQKGNVDWLMGQEKDVEEKDTYSAFIQDVDTVIMGWNTYHQIVTELSPENWVYDDLTTYVITHHDRDDSENIRFVSASPCDLIKYLKKQWGKDIWICGGASIIQQLMKENLIDKFYISIIPTILGNGIHLFGEMEKPCELKLTVSACYNGIMEVIYEKRKGTGKTSQGMV